MKFKSVACLLIALSTIMCSACSHSKDITAENTGFYIDAVSADGKIFAGVENSINLFEPNTDIKVCVKSGDKSLDGNQVTFGFCKSGKSSGDEKQCKMDGCFASQTFSADLNGIYNVTVAVDGAKKLTFKVGVIPKNDTASDEFYYGIQPYLSRAYLWGDDYRVKNMDADRSVTAIMDTAKHLGVNVIRDNLAWEYLQKGAGKKIDTDLQDKMIDVIVRYGMKFNWLLGSNAGEWSTKEEYKSNFDQSKFYTYCPDEKLWDDFVSQVAQRYADNPDILWEVWNEPNWEPFFTGTDEEYFSLLTRTADIIKSKNKSAFVYSGGLAVADRSEYKNFYECASNLISEGKLDGWGYHNHDPLYEYYTKMAQTNRLATDAGMDTSLGIDSESGIYGVDPATIALKTLYTRATGQKGYISFSFRQAGANSEDMNSYAFFDKYLQPNDAVIAYSTVIRFLGNATHVKTVSDSSEKVIDLYSSDGKSILCMYSFKGAEQFELPDGNYTLYDMYGNRMDKADTLTLIARPVYAVYDSELKL